MSDAIRIQFTHVGIMRRAFEVTLDVFQHARLITRRHRYEDVVAAAPGRRLTDRGRIVMLSRTS